MSLLWGYHPNYVEAMLKRSRAALRGVEDAVKERWLRVNAGAVPAGSDVAELAAGAGLPEFTVKHVELLVRLHKEVFTAVNNAVLMEPLSIWERWYVRRELRNAVKTAERSARDILYDLNKPHH